MYLLSVNDSVYTTYTWKCRLLILYNICTMYTLSRQAVCLLNLIQKARNELIFWKNRRGWTCSHFKSSKDADQGYNIMVDDPNQSVPDRPGKNFKKV